MDLKPYVQKLKDMGLEKAEDVLKDVIELVFEMGDDYVKSTPNAYDDTAYALIVAYKGKLMEMADKLDGKEG